MTTPAFRRSSLALAALGCGLLPVMAVATVPLGAEFAVNVLTTGNQRIPAVAVDADGDFVLAWVGSYDIFARRYSGAGKPLGGEFRVNTLTAGFQGAVALAVDADGDFVVAWASLGADGDGYGIRARRYNAVGVALGDEFPVNDVHTSGSQSAPAVAMDADGDFVVAWQSFYGGGSGDLIAARRYTAAGMPQGSEVMVSMPGSLVAVAMDADGDFLLAWQSQGSAYYLADPSENGIRARRYNALGAPRGIEFAVNTFTTGNQAQPAVAMDADGDFVVAWHSAGADGSGDGIRARRYNAGGLAQDDEFAVNSFTPGIQNGPAVGMDADGDFVLAWESEGADASGYGMAARRYSAAGLAQGGEFAVNTYTTGAQRSAAAAMDADGDLVVAWSSYADADGSDGIRARRYRGTEDVNLALVQSDSADPAPVGSSLTYTLRAFNLHPEDETIGIAPLDAAIGAAGGVRVVAALPAGYSGLSASGSGWTCAPPTTQLRCDYGPVLPAGADAAALSLRLTPPEAPGTVIRNIATVSAQQSDADAANNRDVETTQLVCAASVIQFSAAVYAAAEDAGSASLTATRSGGACGAASVSFSTLAGSALAGSDYTVGSGVLSWVDGELGDKSFALSLLDDALDEAVETFRAVLGNAQGASLGSVAQVPVRIIDNDVSPRLSFGTASQSVGEAAGLATVTVHLSQVSGRSVSVGLSRSGTAEAGADYIANAEALTLPAGTTAVSFDVEIVDDELTEAAQESAVFTLVSPVGAGLASPGTHTLNLADNEAPPLVSFTAAASSGGETLVRNATVTLSKASTVTVTVPFSIGGTAVLGTDYALGRNSPLSFAPGTTQLVIATTPFDDTASEPSETVVLTLGAPVNASLGTTRVHTRTIVDNDS